MPYTVKAVIKKDGDGWSAAIPSLDISTAGHKTLERCLDELTPAIAWKVKEDFQSQAPVTARINAMAVRVEFEIDVEKNHTLEEFVPPKRKGAPATATPAEPPGRLSKREQDCHGCDHWKTKKTFKATCSKVGELLFRGGTKTAEQIMEEVKKYGCDGFLKPAPKKLKVGSPELKKATEKANSKKKPTKDGTRAHIEALMEDPKTRDAAAAGMKAAAEQFQQDALHAGDPCYKCEGADRCSRKDPRGGCLDEVLAADAAKTEPVKKPLRKKGAKPGAANAPAE